MTAVVGSYRLNGPYDPDSGAGGDQPRGFDQLALIYGAYRVLSARITLEFTAASQPGAYVGYRVRRSTAGASSGYTLGAISQQPFTQLRLLPTSGTMKATFKFTVDPSAVWGMRESQLIDDPNFASLVNTVPANQVYIDILGVNINGTATSQAFILRVDYLVEWSQPTLLVDA